MSTEVKYTIRVQTFLVAFILTFTACETETFIDYYVENRASSIIYVYGKDLVHATMINDSLLPGKTMMIAGWRKWGKKTDSFDPKDMFGNTLVITNAVGDSCQKDHGLVSNWRTEIDEKRAVADHKYTLVINNADF